MIRIIRTTHLVYRWTFRDGDAVYDRRRLAGEYGRYLGTLNSAAVDANRALQTEILDITSALLCSPEPE